MRLSKFLPLVFIGAIASADTIILKDGSHYEGTLTPARERGMSVLTTADVEQAKKIGWTRSGWKVRIDKGAAEITLPTEEVEEVADPSHDATPLIQALEHPDKRIRYAAAIALAGMHPKRAFVGADRVVRVLADATAEAGIRVVLVVTDDADLSNRLSAQVRQGQYIPVQAASAFECLGALKRSPGKDAILLDASLGREEGKREPTAAEQADADLLQRVERITHYQSGDKDLPVAKRYARELFLRLQEDYRAKGVPVVVLAEEADLEQVQKIYAGQKVAAFLPKTTDATRVKAALAAIFQKDDPSLRDSKDLADEAAKSACRALAGLTRDDPVFRVADAEEALVRTFSESTDPRRADAVRVAALDAAAALGTPASYNELLKVLGNAANAVEVRRGAARAVAAVAKASGQPCPTSLVAGLKAALKDPDAEVWEAAARGLGLSQIDLAQIRDVWAQERLEKPLKE